MATDPRSPDTERRLCRLDACDDYAAAGWETDLRGLDLVDTDGTRLGQIRDLIVDPGAGAVRYVDVMLDLQFADTDNVRHTLIPIGVVEFDGDDEHHAVLRGADRTVLLEAPSYTGIPIGRDYEEALRRLYTADEAGTAAPADFYAHDHFDVRRVADSRRR